jgi:hypothetical protein
LAQPAEVASRVLSGANTTGGRSSGQRAPPLFGGPEGLQPSGTIATEPGGHGIAMQGQTRGGLAPRGHLPGMNYPAASCKVSNPRLRIPGARQFGGGILVWHANLRTTPTGRLGDAVAHNLFHCLAAAHPGE